MPRTCAYVSPPDGLADFCAKEKRRDWPEFRSWLDLIRKAEVKFKWLEQNSDSLTFDTAEPHEREASDLMEAADALAAIMERREIVTDRHAAMLAAIAVAAAEREVNDMFAAWALSDLKHHSLGRRMSARVLLRAVRQIVEDGTQPEVNFTTEGRSDA